MMYQHILIPIDGSDLAKVGLDAGLTLARALNVPVTILTVDVPFHILSGESIQLESVRSEYEQQIKDRSNSLLELAAEKARAKGVSCTTERQIEERPYQAIIDAALTFGCDLIVMSSHGRGEIAAAVLGSQTYKVLTHSNVPVLVYR